MSYHHFTTIERGRIQELLQIGYSHRKIAQKLNRHRASIDREVKRNAAVGIYEGECAQKSYTIRRKNSKPKGKINDKLI